MKPKRDILAWYHPGLRVLWCLVLAGLFHDDRAIGRSTLYDGSEQMTQNTQDRAADHREAFLSWAWRAAIPLPASPEEPLGERAQAALDRMLAGKRFAFLGEPDHFILEKYPFRLLFIQYLLQRGWRHASMETGRSVGWRVERYLETGDASCLSMEGAESPGLTALAVNGKTLGFIDAHENTFHERLRQISGAGDRFLLPLDEVDPQIRAILSQANFRSASGEYASTDLTAQADAICFVREVNPE